MPATIVAHTAPRSRAVLGAAVLATEVFAWLTRRMGGNAVDFILPPAEGFALHQQFAMQDETWKKYIQPHVYCDTAAMSDPQMWLCHFQALLCAAALVRSGTCNSVTVQALVNSFAKSCTKRPDKDIGGTRCEFRVAGEGYKQIFLNCQLVRDKIGEAGGALVHPVPAPALPVPPNYEELGRQMEKRAMALRQHVLGAAAAAEPSQSEVTFVMMRRKLGAAQDENKSLVKKVSQLQEVNEGLQAALERLREENAALKRQCEEAKATESTCILCMDAKPVFANQPCGHVTLCSECLLVYQNSQHGNTCSVCRNLVTRVQRVFL